MKPSAAVASTDATVARVTSTTTTTKIPPTRRRSRATNRGTTAIALATDVLAATVISWVRRYSRLSTVIQATSISEPTAASSVPSHATPASFVQRYAMMIETR